MPFWPPPTAIRRWTTGPSPKACGGKNSLTYLPIGDLLSLEDYYRTDLHWRQEQLTDVAARLLEGMGAEAPGTFREETLPTPYYGVYYGYAALPMEPDTIRYLTNDTLESCTVYHYETGQTTGIYDGEKGRRAGPPTSGSSPAPSPLLTVENPHAATDRELVIFRDSFASSLAPPSGGAVCQNHAGGHPIPFQHNAWKVSYLYRSGMCCFCIASPVLNHSDTLEMTPSSLTWPQRFPCLAAVLLTPC